MWMHAGLYESFASSAFGAFVCCHDVFRSDIGTTSQTHQVLAPIARDNIISPGSWGRICTMQDSILGFFEHGLGCFEGTMAW